MKLQIPIPRQIGGHFHNFVRQYVAAGKAMWHPLQPNSFMGKLYLLATVAIAEQLFTVIQTIEGALVHGQFVR
jgi:hypothetical protein